MPAPPKFKTNRYFAAQRQCAARCPIRTRIHSRAGKSPRACQTWRPGKRRKSRYRTRALPPYCRITCSVLRGQRRWGDRVSGWSVTGGVGTLCGSRLHATSAVLETGYRLARLFRHRDSFRGFHTARISHRRPNSANVLYQEKVRQFPIKGIRVGLTVRGYANVYNRSYPRRVCGGGRHHKLPLSGYHVEPVPGCRGFFIVVDISRATVCRPRDPNIFRQAARKALGFSPCEGIELTLAAQLSSEGKFAIGGDHVGLEVR